MSGGSDGDPIDQLVEQTTRTIRDHGWAVMATIVGGTLMAYTVGMSGQGLPELVVLGLSPTHAGVLLNEAGTAHAVEPLRPGAVWTQAQVGTWRVQWPTWVWASSLNLAYRLYGRPRVSAIELVEEP